MRPIPPDWTPSDLTVRHAERAREYVLSNSLLFEHLAKGDHDWVMPRSQMWYYEIERESAIKKKQLNLFLSEMPADDQEAFQSTNISAFQPETLLLHRSRIRDPVGVFTIAGTGIPNDLVVGRREWDTAKPAIPIKASSLLRTSEQWSLIPLKYEGYSATSAGLKLFLWEWPEDDATYGLGVDTSDGVGLDWSVIEVLRSEFPHGCDRQIAEFASPYIKALQLWPHILALGIFFSTYQSRVQRKVPCRIAIECRGNGETAQFELQKRGWTNFHPWKRLDNKRPVQPGEIRKMGVFTVQWYRNSMLDRLLSMLEDDVLEVVSPYFVDEMEALERDEVRQSLKAVFGEHDDRIMALGFILDSLHVDDRPYGRSAYARDAGLVMQHPGLQEETQAPVYAAYRPPLQAMDLPRRVELPLIKPRYGAVAIDRYRNPDVPERYR